MPSYIISAPTSWDQLRAWASETMHLKTSDYKNSKYVFGEREVINPNYVAVLNMISIIDQFAASLSAPPPQMAAFSVGNGSIRITIPMKTIWEVIVYTLRSDGTFAAWAQRGAHASSETDYGNLNDDDQYDPSRPVPFIDRISDL